MPCDATGTAAMADRPVDQLSGGELQRVWLATCLAQETGVLLLDEPTNHLDLRYQVEILDLVRELADEHGTALGVVLHDLNHAAAVADDRSCCCSTAASAPRRTAADVLTADAPVGGLRIAVRTQRRPRDPGRMRVEPSAATTPDVRPPHHLEEA